MHKRVHIQVHVQTHAYTYTEPVAMLKTRSLTLQYDKLTAHIDMLYTYTYAFTDTYTDTYAHTYMETVAPLTTHSLTL